jgi:hypothetical protein
MEIKVFKEAVSKKELATIASEGFGEMVKVVVDLAQGIMAVGGELHADEEVLLVETYGSRRENTWGINLYPNQPGDDWMEFDSMVNIKPAQGNRSRSVENEGIKEKIRAVVKKLIIE